jgi:hypothetical protein
MKHSLSWFFSYNPRNLRVCRTPAVSKANELYAKGQYEALQPI